ncbi:hypothetical protein BDN72DRAFT_479127 [Pluteus cervinus]|uniref:Uncharacterized protein n=1 Tax=Pluteus cervinus TaxID=181527 RepID=A0ACD3B0M7_9AGAR|nr:hypothetical protein BDN72DRAFT_479127 [Pluteus cervinus]
MQAFATSSSLPDAHYFIDQPNPTQHHLPVKTEASSSPDLSPGPTSLQRFQFQFHPQQPLSHDDLPPLRNTSESPHSLPQHPIYRFGSGSTTPFNPMPSQPWSTSARLGLAAPTAYNTTSKHDLAAIEQAMSYSDEYDDGTELADLPMSAHGFGGLSGSPTGNAAQEKRRRSSKACDQCRKSKCKCERVSLGEPCKSCVMLGTPCTFLGPSRKRGPPKGYIDAIEARLHQTEALIGIMLASGDERAQTLLNDIAKDPLAKEIINRVDNSPYGVKGRKRDDVAPNGNKPRIGQNPSSDSSLYGHQKSESNGRVELGSTHPSNQWQDQVSAMLRASTLGRGRGGYSDGPTHTRSMSSSELTNGRPVLRVNPQESGSTAGGSTALSDDNHSPGRRQRRKVASDHEFGFGNMTPVSAGPRDAIPSTQSAQPFNGRSNFGAISPRNSTYGLNGTTHRSPSPVDSVSSGSEDELTGAVGQLSLNEDEQVRYHGKASGLHLLGNKERLDARNEGGIWRFPKARVWPPLPSGSRTMNGEGEYPSQLPDRSTQEHLLDLYFTHVHPSFPVVQKRALLDTFVSSPTGSMDAQSPESDTNGTPNPSAPYNRRRRRIPALLLLAMYSIAARYDDTTNPPPSDGSLMWVAGDEYLDRAKVILDGTYASSRPSTCQALLLMGYRELGIGAMAQAWTYIGMAIRMAQDLGMHRSADGWARVGLGGRLFGEEELHERKRIWFTCVIMDKYVSTYIGRPLMIFERDFDTSLPSEDELEEQEEWSTVSLTGERTPPVPGRVISCFNASANLSCILSRIVQTIYAVRPGMSRHAESVVMEGLLDKWYIELPEHLRYDPVTTKVPILPPHILTLHMQYWCAVLLLHRPFIRNVYNPRSKHSEDSDDEKSRAIAEKSYELCAGAANHITSIVATYLERYPLKHCAVFLCYYIFTASIMHVTTLTVHPSDPQARLGLARCMDALRMMETVWPSAGRGLELLRGSKVNLGENEMSTLSNPPDRHKRSAEQSLDDSFENAHPSHLANGTSSTNNGNGDDNGIFDLRSQNFGATTHYSTPTSIYPPATAPGAATATGPDSEMHHPGPSEAVASPHNYFASYERWPSDHSNLGFSGTLSTSVLPQLYSTGLVDDRVSTAQSHHRLHASHSANHSNGNGQAPRYPQFWNDYSTFSQLGHAYSALHETTSLGHGNSSPPLQGSVSGQGAPSANGTTGNGPQPTAASQIYLSEYPIYS